MRYPATDSRGRQISQIGATMHYPSYLESNPDYEAEMRYYHGDTLSPQDKVIFTARARHVLGYFALAVLKQVFSVLR